MPDNPNHTPTDDELYDIAENTPVEYPLCTPGSAMGTGIRERAQRRALYEAGDKAGFKRGYDEGCADMIEAYQFQHAGVDWLLTDDAAEFMRDQDTYGTTMEDALFLLHRRITTGEEQ